MIHAKAWSWLSKAKELEYYYRIANAPRVWFQTWSLSPIEASRRTRDGTSSVLFEAEMGFRLNVWNQTSVPLAILIIPKVIVQAFASLILFL